jgi:coniferyl-aldehyde dehydrogenase
MNSSTQPQTDPWQATALDGLPLRLQAQKSAYARLPYPSLSERLTRLTTLQQLIQKYQDEFATAIHQDYGNRAVAETKIGEVLTCLAQIDYYKKNLGAWMRPSKRHISLIHQPAKGWVEHQPLGVIGIIAPWNYPLLLSIGPLICALAAGNHAMLKISSAAKHFGELLEKVLSEGFDQNVVCVINGGGAISDAFSQLPFDKIIFTGSTTVGKTVMRYAADNLVPVLLELGGKSPAIVHPSMPLADAAQRIMAGKLWNAGQTCVAPDYLFLPRGQTQEFIAHYRMYVQRSYPSLKDNPDYTSIINDKQYARLQAYLLQAQQQGASIISINPLDEDLAPCRKIAPTLISNVPTDLALMQDEIFGPLLPILEYDSIDEVLQFINARPRPLALYYFDYHKARARYVASQTHSGHFGHNQVLTHVAQDDLPFGGIGASGMGKYHGPEGFVSFSHERSMMSNPRLYSFKYILPPFNKAIHQFLYKILLKK